MIRPNRKSLFSATVAGVALAITGFAGQSAHAEESLMIRDFVLTHGVSDREPIDKSTAYNVEDGRVFAFARINNQGSPTTVNFVWRYGGEEHGSVPMSIGTSSGWRTWSSANLKPGNWNVKLVDANGNILSEQSFTVGMKAGTAQNGMDQEISTAVSGAPNTPAYGDMDDAHNVNSSSASGLEDRSGL